MPRLPSRYEDLDEAFRSRLRPNSLLLDAVKKAYASIKVSGGIRFLPVYGKSGCGKSCATLELNSHLPECKVIKLPREAVANHRSIEKLIPREHERLGSPNLLITIVDQYEEQVVQRTEIPSQFIEALSLFDRGQFRNLPTLFLWLTTSREFRDLLVVATRRNSRILVEPNFELQGLPKEDWPVIIEETFRFHNSDEPLANYEILTEDLGRAVVDSDTLGTTIENLALQIAALGENLQDLSEYMVIMLWPCTDAHRVTLISSFTDAQNGYRLDWDKWYRELSKDDRAKLPFKAFNRARLYFDMRLIPIAAADLHQLCLEMDNEAFTLQHSYLESFSRTHLFSIINESWNPDSFTALRIFDSNRSKNAKEWYESVTIEPTKLGKRIAKIFRELGMNARHEVSIASPTSQLRADVFIDRPVHPKSKVILELKAYNTKNTNPSGIRSAIRTTFKRHARFAGFLEAH